MEVSLSLSFFAVKGSRGIEGMPTLGVGLPALEIEKAFPQATPATSFPPSGEFSIHQASGFGCPYLWFFLAGEEDTSSVVNPANLS